MELNGLSRCPVVLRNSNAGRPIHFLCLIVIQYGTVFESSMYGCDANCLSRCTVPETGNASLAAILFLGLLSVGSSFFLFSVQLLFCNQSSNVSGH